MATDWDAYFAARLGSSGGVTRPVVRFTPPKPPEPKKPKNRSILGQIRYAVSSAPVGAVKFGIEAVRAPVTLPLWVVRQARDVASGDQSFGAAVRNWGDVATLGVFTEGRGAFEDAAPLTASLASSFHRTAMDIRHPERYAQAVREGQIVNKIIEDVTNAALVGGAVAKGVGAGATRAAAAGNTARAASLAKTAARIDKAAKLGGRSIDPLTATESLIRLGGRKTILPVVRRLGSESNRAREGFLGNMARRTVLRTTNAGRQGRPIVAEDTAAGTLAGKRATVESVAASADIGATPRTATVVTAGRAGAPGTVSSFDVTPADIESAATMIHSGEAGGRLGAVVDRIEAQTGRRLAPQVVAHYSQSVLDPDHHITPAAARLADAYRRGELDPDLTATLDAAADAPERILRPFQERYEAGTGSTTGLPDPANLANLPEPTPESFRRHYGTGEYGGEVNDAVARKLSRAGAGLTKADYVAEAVAAGADPALIDEWFTTQQPLEPMLYPASLRGTVVHNAQLRDGMLAQADQLEQAGVSPAVTGVLRDMANAVPVRPWEFTEGGATKYRYLPSNRVAAPTTTAIGRRVEADPTVSTSGFNKMRHEYARSGEGEVPRTFAKLEAATRRAIDSQTRNEIAKHWSEQGSVAAGLLGPAGVAALHAEAQAQALAELGGAVVGPDAVAQVERQTRVHFGNRLVAELKAKGYEPWTDDIGELRTASHAGAMIDETTPFVPRGLVNAVKPYINQHPTPAAVEAVAKFNALWKTAVLAPSIQWQIGDAISSIAMSFAAGGIGPRALLRAANEARRLNRTPEGQRMLAAVENTHGLQFSDMERYYAMGKVKEPRTIIGRGVRRAFDLNEWQNRLARQGFVIAKINEGNRRAGRPLLDESTVGRYADASPETDPATYKAIRDAVKEANRDLGDMVNIPPWQRKYMTAVYPFWTWMRHVALLASRMTIDDPVRLAWTMRLGQYVSSDEDLPPWINSPLRMPGGVMDLSFMWPLGDTESTPFSPFNEQGVARTITGPLSPAIKLGGAALLGIDLGRGTRQFQDSGGDTGPLLFNPRNWRSLGYAAATSIPALRSTLNLMPTSEQGILGIGTGNVRRRPSGEAYPGEAPDIPIGFRLAQLARIPAPQPQASINSFLGRKPRPRLAKRWQTNG